MNVLLDDVVNILIVILKICFKIKIKKFCKCIKVMVNKKWFDCECCLKRYELWKVLN